MTEVRRWVVPRPDREGKPVGVLTIEVVPAQAYDRLRAALRHILDEGGYLDPIWNDEYAEEWALVGYTPPSKENDS